MNELTSEWAEKADNDFHSADLLLTAGEFPIPDAACFHCQQCAEKYLKAFLQEHMVRFERTHSLTLLLGLCKTQEQDFENVRSELEQLENYSVAVRYPGVKISSSTVFCGLGKNEAKLTKNYHAFSQYASEKLYQNKRESQQIFKADRFSE